MFLLDTNVVSETRRLKPHGAVMAWLKSVPDQDLHVSAVTIGEIQAGIEKTREQDAKRAVELEAWLEQVSQAYNVVPADARIFRQWARFMRRRSDTLLEDGLIAATARVHGFTIATRNIGDFKGFGIELLNPWER